MIDNYLTEATVYVVEYNDFNRSIFRIDNFQKYVSLPFLKANIRGFNKSINFSLTLVPCKPFSEMSLSEITVLERARLLSCDGCGTN